MNAVDVLRECARLGVELAVSGDKLQARAASVPPEDLRTAFRQNKADIIALLRQRAALSQRLANGAAWLTAAWAKAATTDDLPALFQRAEQTWVTLEEEFRRLGGLGCALGSDGPCAPGAFIVCPFCLSADVAKRAPEGWTAVFEPSRCCPTCGGRIFWSGGAARQCAGCFLDGPA